MSLGLVGERGFHVDDAAFGLLGTRVRQRVPVGGAVEAVGQPRTASMTVVFVEALIPLQTRSIRHDAFRGNAQALSVGFRHLKVKWGGEGGRRRGKGWKEGEGEGGREER